MVTLQGRSASIYLDGPLPRIIIQPPPALRALGEEVLQALYWKDCASFLKR